MNRLTRQARQEEGFTLAEVVVAIFLVTVGLMGLAGVMSTIAKRQTFSQAVTTMTNLGTTKLEEIKDRSYDAVASETDGFGEIANFPNFKREVIVTPNGDDSLRVVEVKVTATNGQQLSLQTVVAR